MSEQEGKERRGFFRIDDEVALSYRHVYEGEVTDNEGLKIVGNESLSLANELEKMNEVSRIHFRHVEKESPEMARYFSFIEAKINLLAHHMMMDSDELFVKSKQPVNISASGVSFTTDEALYVGGSVEIKFILMPSLASIKTFSKTVSCKPEGAQFRVAVEFSQLNDADRDLLIRHVVKKQMNDIRDQNE
ncbi:MAG: PilZ domain-containing protein [Cycloclasticus sp.]|nr:PilZ domain-containing protein [Cycloclasticus sp.]